MSQSTSVGKVISTFHIEISEAFKALLDEHKTVMIKTQEAIASYKAMQPSGQLLAAMQASNDNDVAEPELRELGQWAFEGADEKWISATVDEDSTVVLHTSNLGSLEHDLGQWYGDGEHVIIGVANAVNWHKSAISRQPVNDVDYLSDTPTDDDTAPIEPVFSAAELAALHPQVTPADMQLLFIKDLADVLIQRMHSQDRFSEDDYAVGADKLMPWDIVYDRGADRFGLVTAAEKEYLSVFFLKSLSVYEFTKLSSGFHKSSLLGNCMRTITVDEVTNFKSVLEAYYG